MPHVHKPLCLLHFWVNPFFSFPLSGVIRNWTLQYKDQDDGNFLEQKQLNRLQMNGTVWMPQGQKPLCLIHLWRVLLSHFLTLSLLSFLSLWGNKNWFIFGRWAKRWTIFVTKSAKQAANCPIWMTQCQEPQFIDYLWHFLILSSLSVLRAAIPRLLSCCSGELAPFNPKFTLRNVTSCIRKPFLTTETMTVLYSLRT